VQQEGHFVAHPYKGYCPVACDLTGFFRPQLRGLTSKHYTSQAGKALPARVLGRVASVGSVGKSGLALPRLVVRAEAGESDAGVQRRLIRQAASPLDTDAVLVADAGFALAALLCCPTLRLVVQAAKNFTTRQNSLPPYKGKGRPPVYGAKVGPLSGWRAGKQTASTPPDATPRWKDGTHTLRAHLFENLVPSDQTPGGRSFRCVVIFDPPYQQPLVLVTDLSVSAYALWRLYRDRWAIEQFPLAAKQRLGTEQAFVFGQQSRWRLPELGLLAGNLLSWVAATRQAVATGFWDRCARPTCGRMSRALSRVHFSELPLSEGQLRKKASVTTPFPKGVKAHRRRKADSLLNTGRLAA
jgi:hypothetical protein